MTSLWCKHAGVLVPSCFTNASPSFPLFFFSFPSVALSWCVTSQSVALGWYVISPSVSPDWCVISPSVALR